MSGLEGHPSQDRLLAFAQCKLSEEEETSIEEHLGHCPSCSSFIAAIPFSSSEIVVDKAKSDGPEPPRAGQEVTIEFGGSDTAIEPQRGEGVERAAQGESLTCPGIGRVGNEPPATPPSAREPLPRVIGRYRIERSLGGGGFGRVYLGYDEDLRRYAAIKVPRLDRFASPEAVEQFLEEAQTAASLRHPGIVTIYEVGRLNGGGLFIAMEYIDGRPLSHVMAAGPMAPQRAAELIAKVAQAVHYAHKRGLVHRDLKPANILLDADGEPHVSDFGLAVHEDAQRRHAGEVAGTPPYMSPEQVRGEAHRLDGRTDVWSTGVMLYELLCGRRPFSGSREQVYDEILHRDPKPPRQINDAIPSEIERICLKCLEKQTTKRYSAAGDVASELTRALRPAEPRRRFGPVAALLAGLLVAIALATAAVLLLVPDEETELPIPGKWFRLLRRAPTEVFVPPDLEVKPWSHDGTTETVTVNCPDTVLLRLGTADASGYAIQMGVRKYAFSGSAGVYFDYRSRVNDEGQRVSTFQTITLDCHSDKNGLARCTIQRHSFELRSNPPARPSRHAHRIKSVTVDHPGFQESILEIVVKGRRIAKIRWGANDLTEKLLTESTARYNTLEPREGEFGLYSYYGATTFSNGQVMILPRSSQWQSKSSRRQSQRGQRQLQSRMRR